MSFNTVCLSGYQEAQCAEREDVANGENQDTSTEYFRLLPVVSFWFA